MVVLIGVSVMILFICIADIVLFFSRVSPVPEKKKVEKFVYTHDDFIRDMLDNVPLEIIMNKCRAVGGVPRRPEKEELKPVVNVFTTSAGMVGNAREEDLFLRRIGGAGGFGASGNSGVSGSYGIDGLTFVYSTTTVCTPVAMQITLDSRDMF